MGNAPDYALLASDGTTWTPASRRGRRLLLVVHAGAFTPAAAALVAGLPAGEDVLVVGPDAVPAQVAWLKQLGCVAPCARAPAGLGVSLGLPQGGLVWLDAAGERCGRDWSPLPEPVVPQPTATPSEPVQTASPPPAPPPEPPAPPPEPPPTPRAAPITAARPTAGAFPPRAAARPEPEPLPPPPSRGGLRDLLLVGLGVGVGAGGVWLLTRPTPPAAPEPAAPPAAEVAPAPPTSVGAPDPKVLEVVEEGLPILNLSLTEDGGSLQGFGDTEARNGIPDGWRVNTKRGKASFAKSAPRDGQEWVDVRYDAATGANFLSRHVPAEEGETFVLTTTLDTGEGNPLHPVSFGVAFFNGQEFLDWALHRVESEFAGPQPIEIRATAPAGTTMMRVRWHFMDDEKKPAGRFSFAVPIVKRLSARSRSADFPLEHIFLLTVETWRSDHTTMRDYARDTTPRLAELAREGAWLDRHYVQAPYTRPSLSSMVTSMFPASLGVRDNVDFLPASALTVAERFAEGGYVTSAFLAQYVLSQHYGFNQGFHYFYNYKNDTPGEVVMDAFGPWWEAHREDNTFTWMHLFDPHGPYRPTPERRARFEGDAVWSRDDMTVKAGKGNATGKFVPAYVHDEGKLERRHYVAGYDAEIYGIDEQIGAFIDGLKKAGLAERSLVVVTADHGESMTDHGRWFCHGNLYEHDTRVPMLVWAPGRVKPGTVVTQRTSHLDIVPTLLDYAGVPTTGTVAGASMRGLLDGGTRATADFTFTGVGKGEKEMIAVLDDGPLKVIVDHTGKPVEAYDLAKDPQELDDLVDTRAAEAADLAARFRTWFQANGGASPAPAQAERELSKEETEKLQALGYLEE